MAWLALAGVADAAESPPAGRIGIDVGVGSESQTSPLFQISPESTIVYLGGLQRLRGTHLRTSVQGSTDWSLGGGLSVSLAGDVTVKRAPSAADFDFLNLSLQPALHVPLAGSSFGLGLNLQHMDVGGRPFRDVSGIQASLTQAAGKNLMAVIADLGRNRHKGELEMLDGTSASLVLQSQFAEPMVGVDSLEATAILGRERNGRGFRELSDRNALISLAVNWKMFGGGWTAGRGWRRARFDDTAFLTEPPREDRTSMTDFAAEWPISERLSFRVELNKVRNASTTPLYDNSYRQLAVALRTSL